MSVELYGADLQPYAPGPHVLLTFMAFVQN